MSGIISREEAWQMWQPYGGRGFEGLDGSLDPNNITPAEAHAVLSGTNHADLQKAFDIVGEVNLNTVRSAFEHGASPQLTELIIATNDKRNEETQRVREWAINDGPTFVAELGRTVTKLATEGYWTNSQAAMLQERLLGPDGLPFIQDLPMTKLEATRISKSENPKDTINLSIGTTQLIYWPGSDVTLGNRVHENVHAPIAGMQLYSGVDKFGNEIPRAIDLGLLWEGFSSVKGIEENEGWAQDATIALELASNGLRRYFREGFDNTDKMGYWPWMKQVRMLRSTYPRTHEALVTAALTDATPDDPYAKNSARLQMNELADKELGMKNAIRTIFEAEQKAKDLPIFAI